MLAETGPSSLVLSDDAKRLLIGFEVDEKGLSKAGVYGLIDALKKARDKMER